MTRAAPVLALTGGSGFIGRRFAAAARARGYRIRQLSRHPRAAFDAADDVHLIDLDAADPRIPSLQGCAAVVHLAAHIPRDHDDPAEAARCWHVNALGTLRLAEAAARTSGCRFIQTTSANAYAPSAVPPDEDAALFPRSRGYYLGSKIMQEIYATEACRGGGVPLATLRLSSVYGAGQGAGAVATLATAIADGRPVRLIDDGRFGADFVHVDDVVRALMLVLDQRLCGTFNVGSGVRTTIAQLAQALLAMIGDGASSLIVEPPLGPVDDGFPALDIGRLRALGYTPCTLAAGLAATIENHPRPLASAAG